MTAPLPPAGLLLRLILVVVGLSLPGMAPGPGAASGETASTAPLRLTAEAPAIRVAAPVTPDATAPALTPAPAQATRPDTAVHRLTALALATPAAHPGLPPRARAPPLG